MLSTKLKMPNLSAITHLIKDLYDKDNLCWSVPFRLKTRRLLLISYKDVCSSRSFERQKSRQRSRNNQNAGQKSVTIATNMAGRGTDIKLSDETRTLGGLFIMGTERHEARRIDNQLRGRSGRQGDPGRSKFFLSLEDDLMRIFGSERIKGIMTTMGMEDDEPIEHKMITNAIARAQKKVEAHNFEIRKHLLEYDNVMNEQRRVIYRIRRDILGDNDNLGFVKELLEDVVLLYVDNYRRKKKVPVDSRPWGRNGEWI